MGVEILARTLRICDSGQLLRFVVPQFPYLVKWMTALTSQGC